MENLNDNNFICAQCLSFAPEKLSEEIEGKLYCGECYEKLINAKVVEYEVSYGYRTFFGKIGAGVLTFESDSLELLQQSIFEKVLIHLSENERPPSLQNLQITIQNNAE